MKIRFLLLIRCKHGRKRSSDLDFVYTLGFSDSEGLRSEKAMERTLKKSSIFFKWKVSKPSHIPINLPI